ncbi:MAG: hypothetical protein HY719_12120, partial [Planctomycetes bacterium]|nr:hypothetical protein [Planctomycetota bacterium]
FKRLSESDLVRAAAAAAAETGAVVFHIARAGGGGGPISGGGRTGRGARTLFDPSGSGGADGQVSFIAHKVSVNVAGLVARGAEAGMGEPALFERLKALVTLAGEAHHQFRRFLKRRVTGESERAEAARRAIDEAGALVGLEGLAEAAHMLAGAPADQSDAALRQGYALLAEVYFHLSAGGVGAGLDDDCHPEALARLAALDRPHLKADLLGAVDLAGGYSPGARLPDRSGVPFLHRVRRESRLRSFFDQPGVIRAPCRLGGWRVEEVLSIVQEAAERTDAPGVAFPAYFMACGACGALAPGPHARCPHCRNQALTGWGSGSGRYRRERFVSPDQDASGLFGPVSVAVRQV